MPIIIAHLDMDAFFAAIEERNNPRFAGLPIVVGADPKRGEGRGVVSTANYAAREYGIRSALPITKAWKFSEEARLQGKPAAIFLPGSFEVYNRVSKSIMKVLESYAPQVQQVGSDEAYFDLSFAGSFSDAAEICRKIKRAIMKKEMLTASVGIGPNKLIAKIASDAQKPDGLTVVAPDTVQDFLDPLSVRAIPGIGPKTEIVLQRQEIYTVKQAREKLPVSSRLYNKVRGIGSVSLQDDRPAKSIGKQVTFFKDTLESAVILQRAQEICEKITELRSNGGFASARTITVTARLNNFVTRTRSHTPANPITTVQEAKRHTIRLLLPFFDRRENPEGKPLRLVGVRLEGLE